MRSNNRDYANTLRNILYEKYDRRCAYCGGNILYLEDHTIDHLTPISKGGDDSIENLVSACKSCNPSKGSRTVEEWREALGWRELQDSLPSRPSPNALAMLAEKYPCIRENEFKRIQFYYER